MSNLYNEYYYNNCCGPVSYGDKNVFEPFFANIAKGIISDFAPKTVLDVGCAWGYLVAALRDIGVEAYGTDISEYAIGMIRDDIKPYCAVTSITADLPESFPQHFDLVTNIEVLEHLHEEDCLPAIEKLCSNSDRILFSSSPDDFQEPTHFNVRPLIYWIEQFAKFGFFPRNDLFPTYISGQAVCFERSLNIQAIPEWVKQKFTHDKDEQVIFFGAGNFANARIDGWIAKGLVPICFTDSDAGKHHTIIRSGAQEFEILPLAECLEKYPNCTFYLSVEQAHLQISKLLSTLGVDDTRIKFPDMV